MEEKEIDLIVVFNKIKLNRKSLIFWGMYGMIIGLLVAFSIPREYTARVKVVHENRNQKSGVSLLGGLSGMMGMNVGDFGKETMGVAVYPDVLKSAPFVYEFAEMSVPYQGRDISLFDYLLEEKNRPWWSYFSISSVRSLFVADEEDEKISSFSVFNPTKKQRSFENAMIHSIQTENYPKSGLLEFKVKMQDPMIAAIVADSVVVKLQRYVTNYYTGKERFYLDQLQGMLTKAKEDYYRAELAYAQVQEGSVKRQGQVVENKLERLKNEKDILFMVYQQLASDVEIARAKSTEDMPVVTVIEPARVPEYPSDPNRKLIIIGAIFLAIFLRLAVIGGKSMLQEMKNEAGV